MDRIMQRIVGAIVNGIVGSSGKNYTELQIKTMKFGLETLLNEIVKFLIYFAIFAALSLLPYYLTACIFAFLIRFFAGGYHSDTLLGCLITSFITFLLIVLGGTMISIGVCWKTALAFSSIAVTVLYAPVDHPNKPIVNPDRRKRFRTASIVTAVLLSIIGLALPGSYSNVSILGIFITALMIPAGHFKNRHALRQAEKERLENL